MREWLTIGIEVATFFGLPTLIFYGLSRRHRNAWGAAPPVVLPPGNDDYRSAELVVPGPPLGAPRIVNVAAWTSLLLGQMFVPGLAWGLFGMIFMGIGLVSIPGLVIAARCFWSGVLLIRRDAKAAAFARRTARYSTILNVIIVVGCVIAMALAALGQLDKGVAMGAAPTLLYALLSLTHAWLLAKAADAVAAGRDKDMAQPAVELAAA